MRGGFVWCLRVTKHKSRTKWNKMNVMHSTLTDWKSEATCKLLLLIKIGQWCTEMAFYWLTALLLHIHHKTYAGRKCMIMPWPFWQGVQTNYVYISKKSTNSSSTNIHPDNDSLRSASILHCLKQNVKIMNVKQRWCQKHPSCLDILWRSLINFDLKLLLISTNSFSS